MYHYRVLVQVSQPLLVGGETPLALFFAWRFSSTAVLYRGRPGGPLGRVRCQPFRTQSQQHMDRFPKHFRKEKGFGFPGGKSFRKTVRKHPAWKEGTIAAQGLIVRGLGRITARALVDLVVFGCL